MTTNPNTKNFNAYSALAGAAEIMNQRIALGNSRPHLRTYQHNETDEGIAHFLDTHMTEFEQIYGKPVSDQYLEAMKLMSGVEETVKANNKLATDVLRASVQAFVQTYFPEGEPIELNLSSLNVEIELSAVVCISPVHPFGGAPHMLNYNDGTDAVSLNLVVKDQSGAAWFAPVEVNTAGSWGCKSLEGPISPDHPILRHGAQDIPW